MVTIPETHQGLLEGPIYAVFTTITLGGQPENTVVWRAWDGEYVLVNTVVGRQKERNVRQNPHVALTIVDPANPYHWMDVRGVVEEFIPDPDYAVINSLAKVYQGVDEYYGGYAPLSRRGTEERIVMKIRPVRVLCYPHQ
ncbi:MAG: PPOX class F420-dependent oxidoreductase [Candidatus Promineofilum sp.]|nr:PPOX class F420-dependent oxidoreductase [Promineifilum sp.]MBP9656389.1 PPOX class F420-dependent oxidoreductase [Promineifilum sp.]